LETAGILASRRIVVSMSVNDDEAPLGSSAGHMRPRELARPRGRKRQSRCAAPEGTGAQSRL